MLPTFILIISSIPSPPSLFYSRLKTFLFCKSVATVALLFFFRTDSTDSPGLLIDTSAHSPIRFLGFSFSVFHPLVVVSVR